MVIKRGGNGFFFFFVADGSLDKTIGIGLVTRKRGLAAKGCYQLWSYGLNSGWSVEVRVSF